MTKDKALDALNLFLNGDIDINTLEERVVPLAWNSEYKNQDLVDLISVELAYFKDGLSGESLFRERLAEAITCNEYADIMQRSRIAS